MKYIFPILFFIYTQTLFAQDTIINKEERIATIYQFKVLDINGIEFDLGCLEGTKILIVNTASKCMFAPQLEDLQKLYEKYKNKNFIVIAFPSNSFANREPNENADIAMKYKEKYCIEFPVMSKISVKGDDINPLYDYLTNKVQNGLCDNPVKWNFQKYLIDSEGFLSKIIAPKTNPLDKEITDWIEENE